MDFVKFLVAITTDTTSGETSNSVHPHAESDPTHSSHMLSRSWDVLPRPVLLFASLCKALSAPLCWYTQNKPDLFVCIKISVDVCAV